MNILGILVALVLGLKLLIELGIIKGTLIRLGVKDKEGILLALQEKKITLIIGNWTTDIDISDITPELEELIRDVIEDNKITWREALRIAKKFGK